MRFIHLVSNDTSVSAVANIYERNYPTNIPAVLQQPRHTSDTTTTTITVTH